MAAIDDPRTLGRTRLSFAEPAEIDEFVTVLERFERGEIDADEWRAFRLVRGTYGQRQNEDAQMLRVKVPQGLLDREQLEALADVADRYSRGFAHITTRQNVQFHFVKLHDIEPAMRRLAETGLTTREACGNSVRNITACPLAGVAADERFDVTPYAEALTRYLLRHPLSASLPRKFKIAVEGCPVDHIATTINDIGLIARIWTIDGLPRKGFRVTIGGGTSTLVTAGRVLFDFLAAGEILNLAEAVLRVFHRLGDYQRKQRNRLKYLVRSMGWDAFRAEIETELEQFRSGGGATLPFDPERPPLEEVPASGAAPPPRASVIAARVTSSRTAGPGLTPNVTPQRSRPHDLLRWRATNVSPQKQPGYIMATVTLPLGDLTATQMRILGELAAAYADGTVRTTSEQNLLLRWISAHDVAALHERLAAAGLARADAGTMSDVTSCPGAESCRLAVTQSRGLGRLLTDELHGRPALVSSAPGLNIKISGCPNGCGQHHVSGIGFQGSLRKVGGRPAPHYFVMIGGSSDGSTASFGRHVATVPVRRCREAVERLVHLYRDHRAGAETPRAFFRRVDTALVKARLADLERLSPESAVPDDFIDLGEDQAFVPHVQDGECSA